MGIQVRALALDTAFRTERNRLREEGGLENLRRANSLNDYVQNGEPESKARLWEMIASQSGG